MTKLSEYVIITSSDEENAAIEVEDDAVSTAEDNGHHDYKDPGLGADCKCKANLPPVLHPSKKCTSTLEPATVNAAAKKGKQHAVERKVLNQVKARVFKGIEVIDSSDSEGENPDFLTVRPMQRPRASSASSNCKVSSLRDCSFVNCLFIIQVRWNQIMKMCSCRMVHHKRTPMEIRMYSSFRVSPGYSLLQYWNLHRPPPNTPSSVRMAS